MCQFHGAEDGYGGMRIEALNYKLSTPNVIHLRLLTLIYLPKAHHTVCAIRLPSMHPTYLTVFTLFILRPLFVRGHSEFSRGHKEFNWTITWEQHSPDGFFRQMLLVNGQSPGPVLEVDQDDWVVVWLLNSSPYNTTIHFHGMYPPTHVHPGPFIPAVTQLHAVVYAQHHISSA